MLFIEHDNPVPGNGKTRRSQVHRMLKTMVIAQHHAQLGLPVMVMNGHTQLIGKPTDHFWVKRLTSTADHP
ncbi:hypothetical protein D3C72_1264270 [compost metagenome]